MHVRMRMGMFSLSEVDYPPTIGATEPSRHRNQPQKHHTQDPLSHHVDPLPHAPYVQHISRLRTKCIHSVLWSYCYSYAPSSCCQCMFPLGTLFPHPCFYSGCAQKTHSRKWIANGLWRTFRARTVCTLIVLREVELCVDVNTYIYILLCMKVCLSVCTYVCIHVRISLAKHDGTGSCTRMEIIVYANGWVDNLMDPLNLLDLGGTQACTGAAHRTIPILWQGLICCMVRVLQ